MNGDRDEMLEAAEESLEWMVRRAVKMRKMSRIVLYVAIGTILGGFVTIYNCSVFEMPQWRWFAMVHFFCSLVDWLGFFKLRKKAKAVECARRNYLLMVENRHSMIAIDHYYDQAQAASARF